MNYLIQHGMLHKQAINVPEGLTNILSDITSEVLRCQPSKERICRFIIDYLNSVLETREKAMVAKTILDRAFIQVESIISDLYVCDLSKEKTEMMAQVMEECIHNFLEKRRCEMRRGKELIKFEDIDMLEELLQGGSFTVDELIAARPSIESGYKRFVDAYMSVAEATESTEILYQYFRDRKLKRIQEELRESAATAIQAAWRGFYVRKNFPKDVCSCTCMEEELIDEEELRRDRSARIIQRFFRTLVVEGSTEEELRELKPYNIYFLTPVDPRWEIELERAMRIWDKSTASGDTLRVSTSINQLSTAEETEKSAEDVEPVAEELFEVSAKLPVDFPAEPPTQPEVPPKDEEKPAVKETAQSVASI